MDFSSRNRNDPLAHPNFGHDHEGIISSGSFGCCRSPCLLDGKSRSYLCADPAAFIATIQALIDSLEKEPPPKKNKKG